MNYIAVDIGKKDCKTCIMNPDSSIAEETKYNNTLAEAEVFALFNGEKIWQYVNPNLRLKTYQAFEKYGIGG